MGMSDEQLRAQLAQISKLAEEGKYADAFERAEGLPVAKAAKLALEATIFLSAGAIPQAVTKLRQIRDKKLPLSLAQTLQFALLAQTAQDSQLSSVFVVDALTAASSQEELESVIEVTYNLGLDSLAEVAAKRLEDVASHSTVLLNHRVSRAQHSGDHRRAAELLMAAGLKDDAAFEIRLATALEVHRPNYEAVVVALSDESARSTMIIQSVCLDAQRHHQHLHAVELLLRHLDDAPSSELRTGRLISAMGEALLNDGAAESDNLVAALLRVTEHALERLSRYPEDRLTRGSLGSLMATSESGLLGRFAIRQIFNDRASPAPDTSAPQINTPEVSDDEFEAFLSAGHAWLSGQAVLVIGRSRASLDDLPSSFHAGVLLKAIHQIEKLGHRLDEPNGIEVLQNYVAIIAAFAPHLKGADRNLDIEALKQAATLLARAGHAQKARDLIETVLQIVEGDPRRARAAWIAYGEVHRMTGDPYEAAIAVSAALGCKVPIAPADAWYELLAVHRLARDLGERELALSLLNEAEALPILDQSPQAPSRIQTMRLQIDMVPAIASASSAPATLEAFVARAVAAGRAVLDVNDDPSPIAAILLQTLRIARSHQILVSGDADEIMAQLLRRMPERAAQRLSRFSSDPNIEALVGAATELQGARYGRNFAQDVAPLVILARRHLASAGLTPSGAAFAIELLADHGLMRRDLGGEEIPGNLPASPSEVISTAQAISKCGFNVSLLGLNSADQLVRVDVADGAIADPVHEPADVFSRPRLNDWRRSYPFHYAFLSEADEYGRVPDAFHLGQLFENSVRGLGVSDLPLQRVVLVLDAQLADLPANLLPVDGAFAGETRRIAVTPSLHWLRGAAQRRTKLRGPSFAWVPTVAAATNDLLPRVAMDLEPILAQAGIRMSQAAEIPPELKCAELAIICAHGGLGKVEGRFFRSVADERRHAISGDRIARGLSGAKVAILFICSGGRLDVEPGAQASLGLGRMLLDRGCSAVIGSPWPLSGDIPRRWLPTFLDAWSHGVPVIDASAYANQAVRGQADSRHAMHVYGDPMVTRNPN